MREYTDKSKQVLLYGTVSFIGFITTILIIIAPSLLIPVEAEEISSIYGYLGAGIAVASLYHYRKKKASTKDELIYAGVGWLFSGGAILLGLLGYGMKIIKQVKD